MKTIIAINGGPRKNRNTARLLDRALEGAAAALAGEETVTKRIDLYDIGFTGCKSCFACKLIGGPSQWKCAAADGLKPVLGEVLGCDGVVVGSPIYYGTVTGVLHSFYERLLFPFTPYSHKISIPRKRMPFAFVYTMNVTEEQFRKSGWQRNLDVWEGFVGRTFAYAGNFRAYNTYQFSDYGKYYSDWFSEPEKAEYRRTHWDADLEAAYELGKKLIRDSRP